MKSLSAFAAIAAIAFVLACRQSPGYRAFATPEDAVKALAAAAKSEKVDGIVAIFGPEGRALIDSTDPAAARRSRDVFAAAFRERWRLEPQGGDWMILVVGNEDWPFPVPLKKDTAGWRFDTAAGKEEILARRVGRNELAAIQICRTYVAAQRLYAQRGHDGRPAGLYAAQLRSDDGRENGLYWAAARGQHRSPLGELMAAAAIENRASAGGAAPFHGYFFRILAAQGAAAPGGARSYASDGALSGGFALVAWPAEYDVTGVMTFIVGQDGIVHEKDLGPDTGALAKSLSAYDPDPSWNPIS